MDPAHFNNAQPPQFPGYLDTCNLLNRYHLESRFKLYARAKILLAVHVLLFY